MYVHVPSIPGCNRVRRCDLSDYDQVFDKNFKNSESHVIMAISLWVGDD